MSQTKSPAYQQALSLAEAGQHEQALRLIQVYLQANPNDAEALNDAGTILFCMNRGQEAIASYEKARSRATGDMHSQVTWNLCEAYLQEGRPAEAAVLFDTMAAAGVLNIDILNRAANAFLEREAFGGAMECLLQSLAMSPEQEILQPISEIIRSKRPQVAVVADTESLLAQQVHEYLESRFKTQLVLAQNGNTLDEKTGMIVSVGAGQSLQILSGHKTSVPQIAILAADDVYSDAVEKITWAHLDSVFVCGTTTQMDALTERVPGIQKQTRVQLIDEPFAAKDWTFTARSRGKRLAAMGPYHAHNNPMFLIQGMQKLNYLDRDYRLYLGGRFEDKAIEQQCRYMVSRMNLDGVVFFDGPVVNLNSWLRDKHYFVSAASTVSQISRVWSAMACGLKPVVMAFAGVEEVLDASYVFTIAEEFCGQVQSADYNPKAYRQAVVQHSPRYFHRIMQAGLFRLERQITMSSTTRRQETIPAPAPKPQMIQPTPAPAVPVYQSRYTPPVQPITPVTPIQAPAAFIPPPTMPVAGTPSVSPVGRSIGEIAEEALKASRRLREMLNHQEQTAGTQEAAFSAPFAR